tara:strand:- start:2185 stop:3975 length:1791 start_codon:yes stop_codon:yes gene_type:complete
MAMIDPFGGGKFGQVAGGLLADRRGSDRDKLKLTLGLSVLENIFGNLKINQKQDVIDAANDVKDNYGLIFKDNEEIYANESSNRVNYKRFLDDEDGYLQDAAIKEFNKNPYLRKELGNVNAFSAVNRETLDEDSYKKAMEIFESLKKGEREKIIKLGENPAINTLTFTKFNEPAMNAYKAALAEVEDDPTKKSLLGATFNKIFGTDRNGNFRFGMKEAAELSSKRETAERLRVASLDKSRKELMPDEVENNKNKETVVINKNAKKEVEYFTGTEIPVSFDFKTNEQILKLGKESFIKRVNQNNYQITEDDIVTAVEHGYAIPGFAGLKNIMVSDREHLVKIAAKIKMARVQGLNAEDEGVLNDAERRVWSIATGINVDNLEKNSLELVAAKARMAEAQRKSGLVNIDETKVLKKMGDSTLKATVQAQIDSYLETNPNLQTIYNENLNTQSQEAFMFNVFRTAEYLEETRKVGFDAVIDDAVETQMRGIYKFQEDPSRFYNPFSWADNTTHRVEFVDLNVINQIQKDVETEQDAKNMTNYMNDFRYVQRLQDDKGVTLAPDSLGKEFVEGNYRFFVVDIDPDEDSTILKWNYEYIAD